MASAVPYEPEGFGAPTNPFAEEDTLPNDLSASESGTTATREPSQNPAPVVAPAPALAPAPAPTPVKPVKKYKLVLRITALERQGKKDPIFRFDASVCAKLRLYGFF